MNCEESEPSDGDTRQVWALWTYAGNYAKNPLRLILFAGQPVGPVVKAAFSAYSDDFHKKGRVHIFTEEGHVYSGPVCDLG